MSVYRISSCVLGDFVLRIDSFQLLFAICNISFSPSLSLLLGDHNYGSVILLKAIAMLRQGQ
jgi:hypothetical protein